MNDSAKPDITVLYVEDEASTREEVLQFLQLRAREVLVAKDGNEGLVLFHKHAPDIIVTDIKMPVLDGLKMAAAIRDVNKEVPIIVTTAYSDMAFMLEAITIGVDQYVIKPIDTTKLANALSKCREIVESRRTHTRYLAEREHLIADLQKALAEIKTLHGILPICSHCKKIRDDKGAWQQMETYISNHTDALFSHGICQECAIKLYPEYYQGGKNEAGE